MVLSAPQPAASLSSRFRGRTLALGFGVTVSMWVLGYIALMNPGLIVGELVFGLILLALVAAGWIAGRHRAPGESALWAGAKVGLISATLNMLIVGSLLDRSAERDLIVQVVFWIGGVYGASALLTAIGALIGAATVRNQRSDVSDSGNLTSDFRPLTSSPAPPASPDAPARWYSIFTIVAAATVFLLLITGGLVTSFEAGLAVPDWPNSFGHNMLLYPLHEMLRGPNRAVGVHIEHVHRLYGMLVGLTAITLAGTISHFDRRQWLWRLADALLLLVIIQGVLGGTRVTKTSTALAIVHGVFGQIVFALAVAIAAFTSPLWKSAITAVAKPSARLDRIAAAHVPALLLVQLILGALYRHLGHIHILFTHIFVAVLVTGAIVFAAARTWSFNRDLPVLRRVSKLLLVLVGVQLLLGVLAMVFVLARDADEPIPLTEALSATAHQATGALLLVLGTLLMLWTRRLLRPLGAA